MHNRQDSSSLPYITIFVSFFPVVVTAILEVPSPVPELSLSRARYRGWTLAREERVQENLHAHAQN